MRLETSRDDYVLRRGQMRIFGWSIFLSNLDYIRRLNVPEEVLSNQGMQFMSDCIRETCRLLGIKQKVTTPYHPMYNGLVKRGLMPISKHVFVVCVVNAPGNRNSILTLSSLPT
ncbi:retrovirus-related pol polyprotein from transposon 17.6 [Plakobranchus ocellatus]|uniref:Retrovirus-related pol polyprotein from transposon 17.6 n=1 Tax=Plakobranchus ocellatus TaxID=259542 RepID=A0AAV4DGR1_9GAST|nr:retrovirus-related pol polyprotein from transposon 17.6 [Plakobranchus ocellatus]